MPYYPTLLRHTAPAREALLAHPIYAAARDAGALRVFMASHVFAVWDFMTLLKTLQRQLTCVETPWLPPANRVAARAINEIVLGEETDEVRPGVFQSHFELYLDAMGELGADRAPVLAFVAALRDGVPAERALDAGSVPAPARAFVRDTLRVAREGSVEQVASSFLLGREDLVPEMFRRVLATLGARGERECPAFKRYLDRHVELDGEQHGPLARRLLESLCGDDEARWARATQAACDALRARHALWDGVLAGLRVGGRAPLGAGAADSKPAK